VGVYNPPTYSQVYQSCNIPSNVEKMTTCVNACNSPLGPTVLKQSADSCKLFPPTSTPSSASSAVASSTIAPSSSAVAPSPSASKSDSPATSATTTGAASPSPSISAAQQGVLDTISGTWPIIGTCIQACFNSVGVYNPPTYSQVYQSCNIPSNVEKMTTCVNACNSPLGPTVLKQSADSCKLFPAVSTPSSASSAVASSTMAPSSSAVAPSSSAVAPSSSAVAPSSSPSASKSDSPATSATTTGAASPSPSISAAQQGVLDTISGTWPIIGTCIQACFNSVGVYNPPTYSQVYQSCNIPSNVEKMTTCVNACNSPLGPTVLKQSADSCKLFPATSTPSTASSPAASSTLAPSSSAVAPSSSAVAPSPSASKSDSPATSATTTGAASPSPSISAAQQGVLDTISGTWPIIGACIQACFNSVGVYNPPTFSQVYNSCNIPSNVEKMTTCVNACNSPLGPTVLKQSADSCKLFPAANTPSTASSAAASSTVAPSSSAVAPSSSAVSPSSSPSASKSDSPATSATTTGAASPSPSISAAQQGVLDTISGTWPIIGACIQACFNSVGVYNPPTFSQVYNSCNIPSNVEKMTTCVNACNSPLGPTVLKQSADSCKLFPAASTASTASSVVASSTVAPSSIAPSSSPVAPSSTAVPPSSSAVAPSPSASKSDSPATSATTTGAASPSPSISAAQQGVLDTIAGTWPIIGACIQACFNSVGVYNPPTYSQVYQSCNIPSNVEKMTTCVNACNSPLGPTVLKQSADSCKLFPPASTPSSASSAVASSTAAPSSSAVAPSSSAVAPSSSAVAPSSSVVAPSSSAVAPSSSAVAPSSSAVAPSSSAVAPSPSASKSDSPATSATTTGAASPSPSISAAQQGVLDTIAGTWPIIGACIQACFNSVGVYNPPTYSQVYQSCNIPSNVEKMTTCVNACNSPLGPTVLKQSADSCKLFPPASTPSSASSAVASSTAAPSSSAVAPSSSAVAPSSSAVAPSSSAVAPSSSAVAPSSSAVAPSSSAVAPSSSAVPSSSASKSDSPATSATTKSSAGPSSSADASSTSSRDVASSQASTSTSTVTAVIVPTVPVDPTSATKSNPVVTASQSIKTGYNVDTPVAPASVRPSNLYKAGSARVELVSALMLVVGLVGL
ncbi:hypothetical protein HDU78_005049, partial [Chytriomyces hyalinus]